MEIHKQVDEIETRQDLVVFIEALRNDLDMDGYFQNRGEPVPSQPSWRLVREPAYAAKIYE